MFQQNIQHLSKFQLIETTIYLFLSISLNKVTIIVFRPGPCNEP